MTVPTYRSEDLNCTQWDYNNLAEHHICIRSPFKNPGIPFNTIMCLYLPSAVTHDPRVLIEFKE